MEQHKKAPGTYHGAVFRPSRTLVYEGRMMARILTALEATHIRWNPEYGFYQCEKCKSVMHYNFGFRFCPYCRRKVLSNDTRV